MFFYRFLILNNFIPFAKFWAGLLYFDFIGYYTTAIYTVL